MQVVLFLFLFEFLKVGGIDRVSLWNKHLVPAVVACFISSDRQNCYAARVEGIPTWRTYVSIVLPMLRPLMVTCVVLIAIAVVKSYDLVVAMTNGGPGFASDLPGKFVVDFEFERANIGQASAAATVMLGSVLAIVSPYLYFELARKNR